MVNSLLTLVPGLCWSATLTMAGDDGLVSAVLKCSLHLALVGDAKC